MPIANSREIISEPLGSPAEKVFADILQEQHGIFRVNFRSPSDATRTDNVSLMQVMQNSDDSSLYHVSSAHDESMTPVEVRLDDVEALTKVTSTIAVHGLNFHIADQTSRADIEAISPYLGETPRLDVDPTDWISRNPFIFDLARLDPKYGNVLRYLCNERGLFLKVGNYPSQRAYWNSTLNGGLPVFKKADPIHEGTFMLHDLYHFVPVDPLLGSKTKDPYSVPLYLAHRLMSEATTLVLADMVAIADSKIETRGYDLNKRQIFPLYRSIVEANGSPDTDKLLAANTYFCFTGDATGFRLLNASEDAITAYVQKYAGVFRDDFMWNFQNIQHMIQERKENPLFDEYYEWLATHTNLPTLDQYTDLCDEDGIEIADMLSSFRADYMQAQTYAGAIDDAKRHKLASQKYFAGQRVIFARYGDTVTPDDYLAEFDGYYNRIDTAASIEERRDIDTEMNQIIERYINAIDVKGVLLPHEVIDNKFGVPLYPVRFISYEKTSARTKEQLSAAMSSFVRTNQRQLGRMLEIVQS